jgi:hypothetical protein
MCISVNLLIHPSVRSESAVLRHHFTVYSLTSHALCEPPRIQPDADELHAQANRVASQQRDPVLGVLLSGGRAIPPPHHELRAIARKDAVRSAQKMQVGPCIPVGLQLEKAGVGPTSGPTRRLSHLSAIIGTVFAKPKPGTDSEPFPPRS